MAIGELLDGFLGFSQKQHQNYVPDISWLSGLVLLMS